MTDYACCTICGELVKIYRQFTHNLSKHHNDFVEWNPACEKLAKELSDYRYGIARNDEVALARLWVIENVLKVGWKHDT